MKIKSATLRSAFFGSAVQGSKDIIEIEFDVASLFSYGTFNSVATTYTDSGFGAHYLLTNLPCDVPVGVYVGDVFMDMRNPFREGTWSARFWNDGVNSATACSAYNEEALERWQAGRNYAQHVKPVLDELLEAGYVPHKFKRAYE